MAPRSSVHSSSGVAMRAAASASRRMLRCAGGAEVCWVEDGTGMPVGDGSVRVSADPTGVLTPYGSAGARILRTEVLELLGVGADGRRRVVALRVGPAGGCG